MADHPRWPSQDFHSILCVPIGASIRDVCKTYKSLITRWQNPSSDKIEAEAEHKDISKHYEPLGDKNQQEETMYGVHEFWHNGEGMRGGGDPTSPRGNFYKHRSVDNQFSAIPSPLSRSASRRNHTPIPAQASLLKSMSRRSSSDAFPASLSKSASRRSSANPIMFSNSYGLMKPEAIEKKLECTLEELCFGCVKKIQITRDAVTNNGQILQEEELLTIKVKPGWKTGTKITFEGMGDERPGTCPADITFMIAEKRHPMFRREGDDLELAVEIPLVKALTGCTFSIPLLGGERMSLEIDEIIHPGYEKIIAGQGMPNSKSKEEEET
ncbi:hypothetical protein L1049_027045 [Liquidambar formosana]|uniref:Chaperone DnaJ C-terminal domain-containing protein n=1 Tax=Liquidambar formosana TaxID=63359 RepID=A0AAP0R7T7_LIQFO